MTLNMLKIILTSQFTMGGISINDIITNIFH
uniref:Uncharacterized protein n=1 Tax=Lepeophtheirus salmonis TaxID=72036 RepID=A0A0K2VF69_LEPSM